MRLVNPKHILSLLVFIYLTRKIVARIPGWVEKEEKCAMKKFPGDEHKVRTLCIYDANQRIMHRLDCGQGTLYPDDNAYNACRGVCVFFLTLTPDSIQGQQVRRALLGTEEDEYGLDDGDLKKHLGDGFAVMWVGNPSDGDKRVHECISTQMWNVFHVRDYDDRNYECGENVIAEQDKYSHSPTVFVSSDNHDRGFPLVNIIDSRIERKDTIEFVFKHGCNAAQREANNTCIRMANSRIIGTVDHIHPEDVRKAIEAIRADLSKAKSGEDADRPEHPRQMLYYIMLGVSCFFLLAVIASVFAIPKDHDFPIMYQKGVATVGKKGLNKKKNKKTGGTAGKTTTGLGGTTTAGLTGMAGKTTTGTVRGNEKKKNKKDDKKKKDKSPKKNKNNKKKAKK